MVGAVQWGAGAYVCVPTVGDVWGWTLMGKLGRLARLHARLLVAGNTDAPVAGQELCQACVEALPVDGAAISILTDVAHRGTVAASDAVAERIEHLQFSLGDGP